MSDIIKSSFVAFSENKKEIKIIPSNHPKIIRSSTQHGGNASHELHGEHHMGINKEVLEAQEDIETIYKELVEQAQMEANAIVEEAQERVRRQADEAYQNAYNEGFEKGQNDSYLQQQQLMEAHEQQMRKELEALTYERQNVQKLIEPEMVQIIVELVEKMIGVQAIDPEVILFLIRAGFTEMDGSGDLIVKVSFEDYETVMANKEQLDEQFSEKISLEILRDGSLSKNECLIEADMGTINCSLDTQVQNLMKELKLIGQSLKR